MIFRARLNAPVSNASCSKPAGRACMKCWFVAMIHLWCFLVCLQTYLETPHSFFQALSCACSLSWRVWGETRAPTMPVPTVSPVSGPAYNVIHSGEYGSLSDDELGATTAFGLGASQCNAICNLIKFDDQSASPLSVLYSQSYHTLGFKDDILALDAAYPSIVGDVSADWMLRTSAYGYGVIPGFSEVSYVYAKWGWNVINGAHYEAGIDSAKNVNAPLAASLWLREGVPLRSIFAPSIAQCGCK